MDEEMQEILQNSSNEEYTENKHSEGRNEAINKEADEAEESVIQVEDDGRKCRNLPPLQVQSIRLFHVSLEYSGSKGHLLL